MKNVVTIIPDNFPMAFHIAEGTLHCVQSPSAYMGYRSLISMGAGMNLEYPMPKEDILLTGHYVDHEIVSNIEKDCDNRLRRLKDKKTRRLLLTMGGAGAQVLRFAQIAEYCKADIEDKRVSLFINMGDHKGRWEDLKKEFERVPLSKLSVKRIVEGSYIARGSFYQYFLSKEDVIEYVLRQDLENAKNTIITLLKQNSGNVFNMAYEYLDHAVEEERSKTNYYLHVSEFLKENNIWLFELLDVDEIKKYLDLTILNNIISKEEGLKRFKRELFILKRGALKEEEL